MRMSDVNVRTELLIPELAVAGSSPRSLVFSAETQRQSGGGKLHSAVPCGPQGELETAG